MYSEEELIDFRTAGKITGMAREYGKSLVKVGVRAVDVVDAVDTFIQEHECDLAFPAQVSINNIAAHYGCSYEDSLVFKEGDLVKLDLGAMSNGAIGDSAVSIDLSSDGKHEKLIQASRDALDAAISKVKPGTKVKELGKAIQEAITALGYKPIKNLSGHSVGIYSLHGKPSIPNYDVDNGEVLEEGMIFAIEPFATDGAGRVEDRGEAEIFSVTGKKPVRGQFTRQVLGEIGKRNGMPFVRRWYDEKFGKAKVSFALRELYNVGILHQYPPLVDAGKGLVAQSEHTVLVTKDGCDILTKVD